MPDNVFLDTNIILYQFDYEDLGKQTIAKQIVRDGVREGNLSLSYQVVQEFISVALRKNRIQMEPAHAEAYMRNTLMPMWKVWPSEELYALAMQFTTRYTISFYDALIVAAAVLSGCETLYTEDLQDGMVFESVKVINPFR